MFSNNQSFLQNSTVEPSTSFGINSNGIAFARPRGYPYPGYLPENIYAAGTSSTAQIPSTSNSLNTTLYCNDTKTNIRKRFLNNNETNFEQQIITTKKVRNSTDFVPLPIIKGKASLIKVDVNIIKPDEKQNNNSTPQKTNAQSLKVLSGNVELILNVSKHLSHLYLLLEIYANIINIMVNPKNPLEKFIMLRSDNGPVVQAVYYEVNGKLENVSIGDTIRCVGRCLKNNGRFHIITIEKIDKIDLKNVKRLAALSNFIMNKEKENNKKK